VRCRDVYGLGVVAGCNTDRLARGRCIDRCLNRCRARVECAAVAPPAGCVDADVTAGAVEWWWWCCCWRKDAETRGVHANDVSCSVEIPSPVPAVFKPHRSVVLPDFQIRLVQTGHVIVRVAEVEEEPCVRTLVRGIDELPDGLLPGWISRW